MSAIDSFKRLLSQDERIQDMLNIADAIKASVNFARVLNEAASLHAARPSRTLYRVALQPTKLYEANAHDLRARSRIVELRVSLMVQVLPFKRALDRLSKYLKVTYADDLNELSSTERGRKVILDAVLGQFTELMDEINDTISVLDVYIEDIQSAGYGLTNSTHILQKLLDRPSQVV